MYTEEMIEEFVNDNNFPTGFFRHPTSKLINSKRFRWNLSIWLYKKVNARFKYRDLIKSVILYDRARRSEESYDDIDTIQRFMTLLASCENLEDVMFIWDIKSSTIDLMMVVDQQYLAFCGVEKTAAHLRDIGTTNAIEAVAWVEGCDEIDDMESYKAFRLDVIARSQYLPGED